MNSEEARAHLDAALDGELSAEQRAAFEQALLADPALRAEYERHAQVVAQTRALARAQAAEGVDLLAGVQQRLRARSGGRFYRDRFAEARGRTGLTSLMLAFSALVLLAVAAWLALDAGLLQSATPGH